jgi:hypothetical protein
MTAGAETATGRPDLPRRPRFRPVPRLLVISALIAIPLLVWWVASLPGGATYDTVYIWNQIQTGHWNNHHPAPYIAWLWLTSLGGHTLVTASLADVLVLAVALGWLVESVRRVATARWAYPVALGVVLALSIAPFLGPFSVMLWKDVPTTAALAFLAGVTLRLSTNDAVGRPLLIVLAASGLAVSLTRWNGVLTDIVVALVVLVTGPLRRRLIPAVLLIAAGGTGFAILTATPAVTPVAAAPAIDSAVQTLADLAQWSARDPQDLTAADWRVLRSAAPTIAWTWPGRHSCEVVDPTLYAERAAHADVTPRLAALSALWRRLARRDPAALLRFRLCRTHLAWLPWDNPKTQPIITVISGVTANSYGLHEQSPGWLRSVADQARSIDHERWVQAVFWRPAGWLVALLVLGLLAHLRDRRWRQLAGWLAAPLGTVISYAAFPSSQDARYTYAAVVVAQVGCAVYATTLLRRRTSVPAEMAIEAEPAPDAEPAAEAEPHQASGGASLKAQ